MPVALAPALPRRLPAPALDPPCDDELPGREGVACTDGALALALPLPLALPAPPQPPAWPPLALVHPTVPTRRRRPAPATPERPDGRVPTPREALPPPGPRALLLVRALIEVLAGDRPSRHVALSTSLEVLEQLEGTRRSGSRPWARSLRSVHVSEPVPGIAEVSAVVQRGGRCAALALRLEGLDGQWLVTALELG